ncbi:membrane protein [Lentzea sp. NBRC 105346]|uniref:VIT1/CCC1 transporter family protein n=1 Tax=Lentzea sp. NBRC 105346 TaxID=3032205 RepID=UPI0024A215FE|nr:VIT family protein [Lentzea sp. NBRC 105346]GLZ31674.1 membrane protein [Lentzea sp. NBRC 105346]
MTAHEEPHEEVSGDRMNWLRAGVLGANDGIVSTASLVVGVAGATTALSQIVVAGLAGLFAGAMSMASGEYVSVSSQRDAEKALLAQEKRELKEMPEEELAELTEIYRDKGLTEETAREVATQLTEHDALAAHADAELGIDPEELTNPWGAAIASFISFTIGALLPLVAIVLSPVSLRVPITVVAAVLTLALTGAISARFSGAPRTRAVVRNIVGGLIAMGVTYGIGSLVGQAV